MGHIVQHKTNIAYKSDACTVLRVPAFETNYLWIIHDHVQGKTAVIDPGQAKPVLQALAENGFGLDMILNTHHHADHVGGNKRLHETYSCPVYASSYDAGKQRIPCVTNTLQEGENVQLGDLNFQVFETPAHTMGHIVYYCASENLLFCGDTVFHMGCGRLFEGSAQDMFDNFARLRQLPPQTLVFCAHEYTKDNLAFAKSIHPDVQYPSFDWQRPSIPFTLKDDIAINPFFMAQTAQDFADMRYKKDHFTC